MSASLEITTVSHCKNVCQYCPQALLLKTYGKKEFMSLETFKKCLSTVPKDVLITFAGYAEPFLNSEASEMMAHANQMGYKISISTTLVGLTDKDIDIIKHIPFTSFVLHLPDDVNAMKTNIDDEFVRIANRFAKEVQYTSSHTYGPLHRLLVPIFTRNVGLSLFNNLHTRANNVDIQKSGLALHPKIKGKMQCDVVLRRKDGNTKLDFNILLPNGDVTLCCMDYGLKHKLGNLLTGRYEDLFTSDEYKRIQEGLSADDSDILCRTCAEGTPL